MAQKLKPSNPVFRFCTIVGLLLGLKCADYWVLDPKLICIVVEH